MKTTRKIIPALALLLISAIVTSTASYAWFVMNTQVVANGLEISANSKVVYLLISQTQKTSDKMTDAEHAAAIQTENKTLINVSVAKTKVYPAAHEAINNSTDANAIASRICGYYHTKTPFETISNEAYNELSDKTGYDPITLLDVKPWYYRTADDKSASDSTKIKNYISDNSMSNYVIHKTLYLTLSDKSEDVTDLRVSHLAMNNIATGNTITNQGVRVLITSSTAAVELGGYELTTDTDIVPGREYYVKKDGIYLKVTTLKKDDIGTYYTRKVSSDTVLADTLTNKNVITVEVYIYYDGSDATVYTNNIANLSGTRFNIMFSVNEPTA